MRYGLSRFACVVALAVIASAAAHARGPLAGPVEAEVVRVIDGDTFEAVARVWPGHSVRVSVRIRGIDAPETRTRCALEKAAAERARIALAQLIGDGTVMLSNVGGGKYYGRVLADVETAAGVDPAAALLADGLVRAYDGGRRMPYCSGE